MATLMFSEVDEKNCDFENFLDRYLGRGHFIDDFGMSFYVHRLFSYIESRSMETQEFNTIMLAKTGCWRERGWKN